MTLWKQSSSRAHELVAHRNDLLVDFRGQSIEHEDRFTSTIRTRKDIFLVSVGILLSAWSCAGAARLGETDNQAANPDGGANSSSQSILQN